MARKTTPPNTELSTLPLAVAPGDIACLIRTVDLGSFSAVAREQDVPASNISRAVARLESAYGVRLLRSSTHGLSVTPEGQTVIDYGRQALGALADLADQLMEPRSQVRGTVRLALSAAYAESLVIPALPELCRIHPELNLELLTDDRAMDLPMEGIDLALRTGEVMNENLVARQIGHFNRGLFCTPGYGAAFGLPTRLEDLQHHRIINHLSARHLNRMRFMVAGQVQEMRIPGHFSANTTALVGQMVLAGLGIGSLNQQLMAPLVRQGRLLEVLAEFRDPTPQPIYTVMLPERHRLPRVRAVVDFLAGLLAE